MPLRGFLGDHLTLTGQTDALAQLLGQGERAATVDADYFCHEFIISHFQHFCKGRLRLAKANIQPWSQAGFNQNAAGLSQPCSGN